MLGRKKHRKTQICDKWWSSQGSREDKISQLPQHLICDILSYLSTKDAVNTSVLSTKWTRLWQLVPGLDLDSRNFSNVSAFSSFVDRFFELQGMRKLRLSVYCCFPDGVTSYLTPSINDALTHKGIQHLDVCFERCCKLHELQIPLSLYTCETLVHLRLVKTTLANAESVSLSCLKTLHLRFNIYPNEATLEKLISCSRVLEDLTITRFTSLTDNLKVLQVRSETLKRFSIIQFEGGGELLELVIDAPGLQFLRIRPCPTPNLKIINIGLIAKVDIDVSFGVLDPNDVSKRSIVHNFLTGISKSKVRALVISHDTAKAIFQYKRLEPRLQFCYLSQLSAKLSSSDLQMLPIILKMCPKLESLILELLEVDDDCPGKQIMFPCVPLCLVSSLKFFELENISFRYEVEMELARYFLKNSTTLKKLTFRLLDACLTRFILKEVLAIPRRSSNCEVVFLAKERIVEQLNI